METDEPNTTSRQTNLLEQTTSSALNSTNDFLVIIFSSRMTSSFFSVFLQTSGNDLGASVFDEDQILDEVARECKYHANDNRADIKSILLFLLDLKFGFKKMAKKNDYILIEEMGDAFRHSGQNPSEDVIKDMVEKARALKKPTQGELIDEGERKKKEFLFEEKSLWIHSSD